MIFVGNADVSPDTAAQHGGYSSSFSNSVALSSRVPMPGI